MIVMDIKLDNVACFNDFNVNFSYPKKIVGSTIEEYLEGFPNFRYKKINILLGGNATGKTSFGKVLMGIFNLLIKENPKPLLSLIDNNNKETLIEMDFVPQSNELFNVIIEIPHFERVEEVAFNDISLYIRKTKIKAKDSYETAKERLVESEPSENIKHIERFGWRFTFPSKYEEERKFSVINVESDKFLPVLRKVLMTLDKSIKDVVKIDIVDNAYAIHFEENSLVIQNGKVIDNDILSSGTEIGIYIADFVTSVLQHKHGFYYCDEQFAYIHSDIEKSILSILTSCVRNDEQFFFTTHNLDILDMDYPKHTFTFLRKEMYEHSFVEFIDAASVLKKNSSSVRRAVEDDVFFSAPDVSSLYELEDLDMVGE